MHVDSLDAFSNAGLVERDAARARRRPTPKKEAPPKRPRKSKASQSSDPRWSADAQVVLAFLRSKPAGATWPELDAWLEATGFARKGPPAKEEAAKKKQKGAAKSQLVQCLAYLEIQRKAHADGLKKPPV